MDIPLWDNNLVLDIEPTSSFYTNVYNRANDTCVNELNNFYLDQEQLRNILCHSAILQHCLAGSLKVKAGGDLKGVLGFDMESSHKIAISWYTIHDLNKPVQEVLQADLSQFKNLLIGGNEPTFWSGFAVNEACGFQINGNLNFDVSVNAAKLLTMALAPVLSLTKGGAQKLPFVVDAQMTIRFGAKATDAFECLIRKTQEHKYQINLRKSQEATRQLGISAGVSVQLVDGDKAAIEALINNYFEKYLGHPISRIEKILKEGAAEMFDNDYVKILAERINYKGDNWEFLKTAFETYLAKIEKAKATVLALLSAKVSLGLSLEYRKSVSNGALLNAVVTEDLLMGHLGKVLMLDVSGLINLARNKDARIEVLNYLSEQGMVFEKRFSFGLSIGNWSLKTFTEEKVQLNEKYYGMDNQREVRAAFMKEKGVQSFGEISSLSVSMDAETPSPHIDLSYSDMDYTLTIATSFSDANVKKWDRKHLKVFLQTALTWGVFREAGFEGQFETIWPLVFRDKDVSYECKIQVSASLFGEVFQILRQHMSIEFFAEAMAASIYPNAADDRSWRLSERLEFYTPLILDIFQKQPIDQVLQDKRYDQYKRWRAHELTALANDVYGGSDSIAAIRDSHGLRTFQKLSGAVNILNESIVKKETVEKDLEKSNLMYAFSVFEQILNDKSGFNQRWMGYLIYKAIERYKPDNLADLTNILTIQHKDDKGNDQLLIVGA